MAWENLSSEIAELMAPEQTPFELGLEAVWRDRVHQASCYQQYYHSLSPEERRAYNKRRNERVRERMGDEAYRQYKRAAKRKWRASLSPEQLAEYRAKDAARSRTDKKRAYYREYYRRKKGKV